MQKISSKLTVTLIFILLANLLGFSQTDSAMNKDIYTIDSVEFEFETIGIIGVINENEEFCWAMDLYAKPNNFQDNQVAPKFSFTQLEETKDFVFNNSFKWKEVSAYNDIIDDWIASFYIYDSHFFKADVEISIEDKKNFFVSIKGKVNLNWETAPTTDFRTFEIRKIIPFNGIICELEDKKKAFEIAQKFINTEGLKWLPKEETSSGENNWLTY